MNLDKQEAIWWGEFKLHNQQTLQWRIGPLTLLVRNIADEWQIAYERADEMHENTLACEITETDLSPDTLANNSRYFIRDHSGILHLKPRLADRPIVSRPWQPFHLTAGEEVTLYVSSPLWIELAVGEKAEKLVEVAIQRPSDTWFGPSTREGELCYASRTSCRLDLAEVPWRPHRAITPVLIRNQADSLLSLERLSLPVPFLPVYSTVNGNLWTPTVILVREEDGDMAALKIEKHAPAEAGQATLVDEPRSRVSTGTLFRAFNALFS